MNCSVCGATPEEQAAVGTQTGASCEVCGATAKQQDIVREKREALMAEIMMAEQQKRDEWKDELDKGLKQLVAQNKAAKEKAERQREIDEHFELVMKMVDSWPY
jgi:hypothetical protein